jgi:large subunit ribosomal protein L32
MALPKYKISRTKKLKRRASCFMPIRKPALVRCPSCGELKRSHFVCHRCGFYRGNFVVAIKVKEKKTD